ncbi:MAG: DUF6089 family protein [Bacteroidota bacterium]
MKRFILSIALLLPFCVQAQNHHEIGLFSGVSNYYGDLQNKFFPSQGQTYRPAAGIFYKYFITPHLGFRFGATFSQLTAADSLSDIPAMKARNLSFTTNIGELHGGLELNLLPIDFDRMKVTPYVFGGVGVFYFNPYVTDDNGNKVFLRPLSTEGEGIPTYPDRKPYSLIQVSFPVGGGLKFFVGKTLMITTEVGFRYTSTDYLDDVSKSYVNLDTLQKYRGKVAVQWSYRGNKAVGADASYLPNYTYVRGDSKANDWYWFGGISVAIYFKAFGNSVHDYLQMHCPKTFISRTRD